MTTFAEMQFTDKVKEFIGSNGLLEDGAHVIVGLSGGADSTALLLVLLRLGYKCTAVHCNFHLRGAESDRDQHFTEELCHKLGVELIIRNYDTQAYAKQQGISIEMAARDLRYADFESIMHECNASAVCIAHHRDDSVETVLLNLIRGTGIKGLTGIKPRNGHIIRPLLCVSRQEIEEWLQSQDQPYVTDSTNLEADYTRNKIRLQLLPLMRSINPDADKAIADTAAHLQQSYSVYKEAVDKAASRIITNNPNGELRIDIPQLLETPSPLAILFEVLSPLGFNSPQIESIAASVQSQPGVRFCSATHEALKDRDSYLIRPIASSGFKPITIDLKPGTSVRLPDGSVFSISTAPADAPISRNADIATFDASLLQGSITVRPWSAGDSFIPYGMKGRKLVSDYLTDIKISPADRPNQLVATFNNDIIWIIGHRPDNRYSVTKQTSLQLIINYTSK